MIRATSTLLRQLAEEKGVTPEAIQLAWLLRHPSHPVPVLGSRRVQAYQQAADAVALPMDAQSWYQIWSAGAGREVA